MMLCKKASPNKQVIVINSSFLYTAPFSKTKEKKKTNPISNRDKTCYLESFTS